MSNQQRDESSPDKASASQAKQPPESNSDTLASAGSVPVNASQPAPPGGQVVGAAGGTDAAAGAQMSGNPGGPGGPSLRDQADAAGVPGAAGGSLAGGGSEAAGAAVAGGTGMGGGGYADDMRAGATTTGAEQATGAGNLSQGDTPVTGSKGGGTTP